MPINTLKNELKNEFTGYWSYLAIQSACKINLFDIIEEQEATIESICHKTNSKISITKYLLDFLVERSYLIKNKAHYYALTNKGTLLTEKHSSSLKYACMLWGEEHLSSWQLLPHTLTTGDSAFEFIYGKSFFNYLSDKPKKLHEYHKAINEYARDDYSTITKIHDFSNHKSIMDVGGSLGTLIQNIAIHNPNVESFLFDKPELAGFVKEDHFSAFYGDFFKSIPAVAEAIIMSRVIHDWDDEKALDILKNCYKAIPSNGTLYLVENLTDQIEKKASLLSLNMHLVTKSFERSLTEYKKLLRKAEFKIIETKQINSNQHLLIAKK